MNDLDRALIEAYWRVWERCKADPGEARRRWVPMKQGRTREDRLNRQVTPDKDYGSTIGTTPRMASSVSGDADGNLRPPMTSAALYKGGCGRRCGVLACPLPGWTIGDYLADRPGMREGLEVGEAERWVPGRGAAHPKQPTGSAVVDDEDGRPRTASAALYGGRYSGGGVDSGGGRFACVKCWGVRNVTQRGRGG